MMWIASSNQVHQRAVPDMSLARDALLEGKVALAEEVVDCGQPPVPDPRSGASAQQDRNNDRNVRLCFISCS